MTDEELVEIGARAIAAHDNNVGPPDIYDNIKSWAEESDDELRKRTRLRDNDLETQLDNREYSRSEIEKWHRQARAVLAAVRPVIEAGERERCATVAERGYCTANGCDLQARYGHSHLCPMGIATAIRAQQAHDEP